jgi:hypothetical protein
VGGTQSGLAWDRFMNYGTGRVAFGFNTNWQLAAPNGIVVPPFFASNNFFTTPYWPPRVEPPKGAPNILLIMTDDTGFGAPSTFGGVIPTPALDRIAANEC